MSLTAISPLDGRYSKQTGELKEHFSEFALMKQRVIVEIEWLLAMSANPALAEIRSLTSEEALLVRQIPATFDIAAAERVKEIERTTNHDVKAIEYFIKERLAGTSLEDIPEWVHFGCTSEDINNLAHALMLKGGIQTSWLPRAILLVDDVAHLAEQWANVPMLAHTHGQPASPTTVGKELAVFVHRWDRQIKQVKAIEYLGKFNGAVGCFNADIIAYPDANWQEIAKNFVTSLGLKYNPLTTQIESHDYIAEAFHALIRFNGILLDFVRDVWSYIGMGYFKQRVVAGEVGSSTMPHKVNPIDFENAEANIGIANSLLEHLASKLQVSRLQRDLTDSSALRNVGVGVAHSVIALKSTSRGLKKLSLDEAKLNAELDANWAVLAEAVQTVMRKHGMANAYERLKDHTRGEPVTAKSMRSLIESLDLPTAERDRLLALTPATYIGLAPQLALRVKRD